MQTIKQTILTIIICLAVVAGVSMVSAWTGPTQSAPNGNTPEPINTSATSQIKGGAFQVNGFHNLGSSIFDGSVTMNTGPDSPQLSLINTGSGGRTWYIYSQQGGNFHIWDAGAPISRLFIQGGTGNVGIGTATPVQKLTVAGAIESTVGGIKFPDGTIQTTAASGDSQGSWCGLDPAGGGSYILCKGYAPESSCPGGYARISISIAGGTLQTSFGNQTPYQTYETVHYTCIKL